MRKQDLYSRSRSVGGEKHSHLSSVLKLENRSVPSSKGPNRYSRSSNTPPSQANRRLRLAPGEELPIGPELLAVSLPEAEPWQVRFAIFQGPRLGRILLRGEPATHFSQADIDRGLLSYRQDKPVHAWSQGDVMVFGLSVNGSVGAGLGQR